MADGGQIERRAGVMRLRGQDIPTVTTEIEQAKLKFFVDNPRIYSLVRSDGHVPDQAEIQKKLLLHEHVRVLKEDIVANDGLIDPLIVRDGDMVVLEGNSRLAAYRYLASNDAIRWGRVKCTLLPADIDDKLVFALLGQYHVKGKKDWAPYEKAGFIYRRFKEQMVDLTIIAAELGVTKGECEQLVNVYQFMIDHDDPDREHWSYYDEFLKSRKIKKVRDERPAFDAFIVEQVKSEAISKAMDLRDRLPVICAGNAKNLKRYAEGSINFDDAYEAAVIAGGDNLALSKLKRFRKWLALNETEDEVLEPSKSVRDTLLYELKAIELRAKKLKELLEKKKSTS
jgi:hypothetical protein